VNPRTISAQGKKPSKIHRLTKPSLQREKGRVSQEGCQVSNFISNWPLYFQSKFVQLSKVSF